jgi:ubiquinone/menaquinone biosynthesis C-methylase UbiE
MTYNHLEYNFRDLLEADKRISLRWKKNKIKLKFNKNSSLLIAGTLNYINKINNLGSKKVFAIDKLRPEFLKLNKFNNVIFKKTNYKKIHFNNNKFDFIFCNGILSHLSCWKKTLKEFERILKPKGKLWLNIFGDSKFRRLPINFKKKINPKEKNIIKKILFLEGWNIQKVNYLENIFFWDNRILFKKKHIENFFLEIGFKKINYLKRGIDTDLSEKVFKNKSLRSLYNDGDLRYILEK